MLDQRVFYYPRDFYMVDELNYQFSVLAANGILDHILSIYVDFSYMNVKSVDPGPMPLNLKSVSGIFYVASALLLLALIVFVIEIFYYRSRKVKKKVVKLIYIK